MYLTTSSLNFQLLKVLVCTIHYSKASSHPNTKKSPDTKKPYQAHASLHTVAAQHSQRPPPSHFLKFTCQFPFRLASHHHPLPLFFSLVIPTSYRDPQFYVIQELTHMVYAAQGLVKWLPTYYCIARFELSHAMPHHLHLSRNRMYVQYPHVYAWISFLVPS